MFQKLEAVEKRYEELTKKIDDLFGELDYYLLNAPFKTEGLKKLLYSMRTRWIY